MDLDGFKAVDDTAGHAAGDAVLRVVTSALTGVVREADTVSRPGGDEFAVLAAPAPGAGPGGVAGRVRAAVTEAGHGRGLSAGVGVVALRPGDDVHEVLHRADAATYRARSAGGDRTTALVSQRLRRCAGWWSPVQAARGVPAGARGRGGGRSPRRRW